MTGETLATNQEAESTVCHACGAPFVCGAMAGLQTCWCMEKPTGLLVVAVSYTHLVSSYVSYRADEMKEWEFILSLIHI